MRLIPSGVWRVLALACSPVFVVAALTAISRPGFGPLFLVLSALIGVCVLLVWCTEKAYEQYDRESRVGPRRR